MKKVLIFGILLSSLATNFNACGKKDNPTPPDLSFPLPLLTKDTTVRGQNNTFGHYVCGDIHWRYAIGVREIDLSQVAGVLSLFVPPKALT